MTTNHNYILTVLLSFLILGLGYGVQQGNFVPLISLYGLFFAIYIYIFQKTNTNKDVLFFVGVGVFLRFCLLFNLPNLSDDLYRFIWDGRLWIQGINPFDQLPSYYINQGIGGESLNQELYDQLNSPNYFTIYPPVAQLNFIIATWIFPNNIWGSSLIMKLFLFGFEIGSLRLIWLMLKRLQLPLKNILLYALNPLIILEITGNLHFEGAMIFFLLLSVWWLLQEKLVGSALFYALSIASKLLPLLFLPFFIYQLGIMKSLKFFCIIGCFLLLLFLPLFSGAFLNNFGESLNLYFQKFEFNASVYYVLRYLGYQWKGYNLIQTIGPRLAVGTFVGILLLAGFHKSKDWQKLFVKMLFAICLYLAFTTIVHPWYTALPVALCVFTRFRFPILWSGLIFLTYINYSYETYTEQLWIVGIEYIIVFAYLLWELRTVKKSSTRIISTGNN